MRNFLRSIAVSALVSSGCYVADTVPAGTVVTADGQAELVEISPGIEVVADYNAPVFFVDGYYWWNNGGIWYQSGWYGGGWYRAPYLSPHLGRIPYPERYSHYRPDGWSRGGRGGRPSGHGGPIHSRPAPRGGGHRR